MTGSSRDVQAQVRNRSWSAGLVLLAFLGSTGTVSATAPPSPPPVIDALALDADQAPTIDGVLDDAVWQRAPRSGGFVQIQPVEFVPATEPTELQIAYTPDTLFVAVRAHDREPEKIVAGEMGLDVGIYRDDGIVLLLDTFHDRRNAYFFETNANSSRTDGLVTDEGRDFNVDWDTIWDVKAHVHEGGWSAEFAIPFSSLRFDPRLDTWGFQVRRVIKRKEETTLWAPVSRDGDMFRLSRAGTIRGLRDLEVGRNLRVTPFVTATARRQEDADGTSTSDEDLDAGVDVKWGLTDGLSLDLTVNTDFAETEVDEVQTNLTRFPLFFPEKRAFFLENAGIFEFGPGLGATVIPFFSRRIGIAPDGRMVDLDFGARLAGRAGPWNLGVLGARTGSLPAAADGGLAAVPETTWGVARVKRNLGQRSFVGMIATHRDGDDGSRQTVFGVDGNWKPNDLWDVWAFALDTDEPTADGGKVDDNGVFGGSVKYSSDDFEGWLAVVDAGENWQPDAGFSFRNGYRNAKTNLLWLPRPAQQTGFWENIRNSLYEVTVDYFEDSAGDKETVFVEVNVMGFQFLSGDFTTLFPRYRFERLDRPFEIAEDVVIPAGEYAWEEVGFVIRTSTGRPVSLDFSVFSGEFFDGDRVNTSVLVEWRPGKRFRSRTTWNHNQVDLPAGSFDTNVLRQRLEFSFTPDLVLDALVQASDVTDSVGMNLRLIWHYQPGSDLFVVYDHGWDAPDLDRFRDLDTRGRQLVVKWTWAWQS